MTGRVLLIGTFPAPMGGISIHLKRLHACLEDHGVSCLRLDESRAPKPGVPNVRQLTPVAYLRLLRTCDVIHIHTSHPVARLAHTLCARFLGRKTVLTVHSLSAPSRSRMARALYKAASRIAHTTIYVSEKVRSELGGAGPVIPAFLPPSRAEQELPAEIGEWVATRKAEGKRILVSNASRLNTFNGEDLYGLDLMIDALTGMTGMACVFVVSSLDGGSDYFDVCQRRINERGLADRFLLINRTMPFAGLIQIADALVRATNSDGDALSIREALWLGKSVIASDCADRPDGVKLFATRDLASLVSALREAPSQPDQRLASVDYGEAILSTYRL